MNSFPATSNFALLVLALLLCLGVFALSLWAQSRRTVSLQNHRSVWSGEPGMPVRKNRGRFYQDDELQARLDEKLGTGTAPPGRVMHQPDDFEPDIKQQVLHGVNDNLDLAESAEPGNLHSRGPEITQLVLAKQNNELNKLRHQVKAQATKLDLLEQHSTSYWLKQTNQEISRLGKAIVQRSAHVDRLARAYKSEVQKTATLSKTDRPAAADSVKKCKALKQKMVSQKKALERERLSMREQTEVHRILKLPQSTHVATLIGLVKQTENLRQGNQQLAEQVRVLKHHYDKMQARSVAEAKRGYPSAVRSAAVAGHKPHSSFSRG